MEVFKRTIRTRTRGQIRGYFIVFIIVTGILASFISFKTIENSGKALSFQSQNRILVLAKSGASSIEFFLNSVGTQLLYVNKIKEVEELREKETRSILKDLISKYSGSPLFGFARIDKYGKVIMAENRERIKIGEGLSVSERPYFQWAKEPENREKTYYSPPFVSSGGVSRGKSILVVAVPSYFNNKFNGVLIATIDIERAISMFIEPLKTSNKGKVFIVDSNGDLVLGDEKLGGRNLLLYAKEKKWPGWEEFSKNLRQVLNEEEGRFEWNFVDGDGNFSFRDQVAFKTMYIGQQKGKLIVANPQDIIQSSLSPIVSSQKWGIVLLICGFILGGILFVVLDQISHKEGYLKGYREAFDELLSRKKKEK